MKNTDWGYNCVMTATNFNSAVVVTAGALKS